MKKRVRKNLICRLLTLNNMDTFKDMVREDIKNIFLDFDLFGEIHRINGNEMLIIVDENELTEREKRIRDMEMGLHNRQLLFYVAAEDFGRLPSPGKLLDFDGKQYIITDAVDEQGIYSISMEVPEQ